MYADEDDRKPPVQAVMRVLDRLGIAELESYIAELRAEIGRAEAEILRKRAINDAASSVFKIG